MKTTALKLVTIVAESILEDKLIRDIHKFGAKGHTIEEVRGEGSRGVRASEVAGKNVKIETLVSAEVADDILTHLVEHYFPFYAVVGYVENVEVVRGDKYL